MDQFIGELYDRIPQLEPKKVPTDQIRLNTSQHIQDLNQVAVEALDKVLHLQGTPGGSVKEALTAIKDVLQAGVTESLLPEVRWLIFDHWWRPSVTQQAENKERQSQSKLGEAHEFDQQATEHHEQILEYGPRGSVAREESRESFFRKQERKLANEGLDLLETANELRQKIHDIAEAAYTGSGESLPPTPDYAEPNNIDPDVIDYVNSTVESVHYQQEEASLLQRIYQKFQDALYGKDKTRKHLNTKFHPLGPQATVAQQQYQKDAASRVQSTKGKRKLFPKLILAAQTRHELRNRPFSEKLATETQDNIARSTLGEFVAEITQFIKTSQDQERVIDHIDAQTASLRRIFPPGTPDTAIEPFRKHIHRDIADDVWQEIDTLFNDRSQQINRLFGYIFGDNLQAINYSWNNWYRSQAAHHKSEIRTFADIFKKPVETVIKAFQFQAFQEYLSSGNSLSHSKVMDLLEQKGYQLQFIEQLLRLRQLVDTLPLDKLPTIARAIRNDQLLQGLQGRTNINIGNPIAKQQAVSRVMAALEKNFGVTQILENRNNLFVSEDSYKRQLQELNKIRNLVIAINSV